MAMLCQCPVCRKQFPAMQATAREEIQNARGQVVSPTAIYTEAERPAETATDGILSLWYGSLYSLIGSVSFAVLWGGIALLWQMEVGWMAWGLGVMSGFGMSCQHTWRRGTWPGMIAALISLAGIFLAKVVVFLAVVLPILRRIELERSIAATPSLFFSTMFDPMDGLFIALAAATAYQLGSRTEPPDFSSC